MRQECGRALCGIAAIIDTRGGAAGPDGETPATSVNREKQLLEMLARIRHRGDEEHFGERLAVPGAALGTNRLAIVGRKDGGQPLADASGLVSVVFNGELYGYEQLRARLRRGGYAFRTSSDTEVLLAAYLEWGESFVGRLDGMYAFVIHDRRFGSFLAGRDHIGIKPLYHLVRDGVHFFASEQKCLVGLARPEGLGGGAEVEEVPPGTYLVDGLKSVPHFALSAGTLACSAEEAASRYRVLFDAAVHKQADTDLKVAVLFSGGIDSAAVLEAACRFHPQVTAFTVGYEDSDDVEVAARYCAERDIAHVVTVLDREAVAEIIPTVIRAGELFEAIDVMDACVAYFAYQAVREHGFKVALCGDGSDEVLAGYAVFRHHPDPARLMAYRTRNLYRTDLQRVDRMSMLHSVETRVPFLDRYLLEFGYRLPMALKLRDGMEKWVLREACRGLLPDYIVDRVKSRMTDGSGLTDAVMSRPRPAGGTDAIARRLGVDTEGGRFFLDEYLKAGYPVPRERWKRPGYDYLDADYVEYTP
jgi:asparagine synthase (glutamine-hydrolysing)